MHRGYIKIWRKIKDSGLYQMPETFALFMHLLTEATHQPRRVGTVKLERGQYVAGRIQLAAELQQTERKIRTGIERLQELEIISVETTSRYSVYTIVNYNNYQDSDQPATSERPASDQPATTKQTHNTKHITQNIKKEPCAAFALPEWVNSAHWEMWVKARKKMTPEQKQGQVDKLAEWREAGLDFAGALQNAAINGTQGLFLPSQPKFTSSPVTRQTENDRVREAARKILFGANEERVIEPI